MDRGERARGERLREARKRAKLSAGQVAARVGYSESSVRALENGQNDLRPDAAEKFAPVLRVSVSWLLTGEGTESPRTVPLVGYVGAGSEAHFYASGDEGLGEVDAPDNATPLTRAAEIRGTSLGPLLEYWLIFYDDVRTPVTEDLLGELCILGLPNDKVLVKQLRAARTPGLYHLYSNNEEPMLDQEVMWAAKVTSMRPR